MKRFYIFLVLLMTANFAFSQRLPEKLAKQFEDTGLFYFAYVHNGINIKPDIVNYDPTKLPLRMSYASDEDYLSGERLYLDPRLFSDTKKATINDIKSVMRRGLNISELPDYSISYKKRRWVDGKKLSFEICYGQSVKSSIPVYGAGLYSFTVFAKESEAEIATVEELDASIDMIKLKSIPESTVPCTLTFENYVDEALLSVSANNTFPFVATFCTAILLNSAILFTSLS